VAAPTAVGVNPSARRAHFVNRSMYDVFLAAGGGLATDAVSVLDTEHGKLLTPVLVGKAVAGDHQGIAVDAVRQRAYVPNADDNTLSVIDTANGLVSDTVSVGRGPTAAAVDPGRGLVYVTNAQDWSVSVLDPSGNALGTVATNGQPQLVALDRSTGRAYVVSERTVVALEGTNKRGELAFPSALSLRAIAVDPGSRLYVAERNGLVHIISLAGGALIETGSLRADDLTSALAVDSTTHQLYVANFGASQIKVFSAAGTLLKTCSVPLGPVGIDIDEAGRKAYVANFRANSYSIIDLNSGAVQNSAPVGTHNTDLAFDREARRIYAANYTGNTVGVIDPAAKQVLASWGTGAGPWAIAADGALRQIYTVNVEDNAVAVLSAVDGSFVREKIPLPDATTSAAVALVNSTNHRLYVTQGHAFGQFLTIIDGRRHAIVKSVRTGERPQGIAVDEDAGLIYVANRNSQSVSVLDANSEEVIAEFPTPGILPYSLALDPDWQQLYITAPPNTPSDFHGLVVMDSFSGEILAHITLGVDPEKVVVHRATGHVFVSDTDGSTVTVVDGYDFKVLRVVPTGTWTYAMTVDPDNGVVYVANGNDGTLNVIRDSFDLGAQAPAQRPARRRRSGAAN
jgi:YVTN family beta-propeller protein